MNFLSLAQKGDFKKTGLVGIVDHLQSHINTKGGVTFADASASKAALTMEGYNEAIGQSLNTVATGLKVCLEQIAQDLSIQPSTAQRVAAIAVGTLGANPAAYAGARKPFNMQSSGNTRYINGGGDVERLSMEAYDEKENKNAAVYTVAYNMQAARQDAFGETLFPTVTVTPDQVGYAVSIHLVSVMDEVRRNISGALDNFNRRNIVHAVRDPSILFNDATKVVPVVRTESEAHFVDDTLLVPATVPVGNENVITSALKFGAKFSLLGISQTQALITAGLLDSTDALDPAMKLDAVVLKLGATGSEELIRIPTGDLPRATFNYSVQGNARLLQLSFDTSSLPINKNTKKADGSTSTILAPLVAGEWSVRLAVKVMGEVDAQTGTTELMATKVTVVSLTDNNGVKHAPTSAAAAAIVALFADAELLGYYLDARRTNSNRRQRGKLLTSDIYNQVYNVPLLAPLTTPRPLGQGDNTDASDLAALINATRVMTSNAAVSKLLETARMLKSWVNNQDGIGDSPEIMGVSRFLLDPFYEYTELKVDVIIGNISSHEKHKDIASVLVNAVRDSAYRMWRDSGWQPAADVLNGGQAKTPTVLVACDPVIARWLIVDGDVRIAGSEFSVKVVATPNIEMKGKMFITFGDENVQEGVPSPLHFGNMAWKPEMTLVLPLHRNGATSKELTVQPSFLHVVNLPVLAEFDVSGIPEIANARAPIAFLEV